MRTASSAAATTKSLLPQSDSGQSATAGVLCIPTKVHAGLAPDSGANDEHADLMV